MRSSNKRVFRIDSRLQHTVILDSMMEITEATNASEVVDDVQGRLADVGDVGNVENVAHPDAMKVECAEVESGEVLPVYPIGGGDSAEIMFLDDLHEDLEVDVASLHFDFVKDGDSAPFDYAVLPPLDESSNAVNSVKREVGSESGSEKPLDSSIALPGMREVPEPSLVAAGRGKEKLKLENNDRWSLRRANQLRHALGWDMSIPFGDLPLLQVDELLANLFSRVVKFDGAQYLASSLVNMMNGYNRILRRASDIRILKGLPGEVVEPHFNIKRHGCFMKTRLVLNAAIKKGGREGVNKKPKKVNFVSEEMEAAVLNDIDHFVLTNTGVQKRLALYLMLRIGIRGGIELWQLQRCDIQIEVDAVGREYVQFEERESKQNQWGINRSQDHQFRNVYHSYEADFVFTVKQYLRHMPPLEEGVVPDLFTSTITNPIGNIWFNKKLKVSKDRSAKWLANMLTLVGLPKDLFSNKSGRTTLITRMATEGVPDDVGMMISGHHTQDGYSRYDRTQHLKQEAAILVSSRPGLNYQSALCEVTETFRKEKVVGNLGNLKSLVAPESMLKLMDVRGSSSSCGSSITNKLPEAGFPPAGQLMLQPANPVGQLILKPANLSDLPRLSKKLEPEMDVLKLNGDPLTLAKWHRDYDGIDWEAAARNDPMLALALAGRRAPQLTFGQNLGGNFSNCTIHIHTGVALERTGSEAPERTGAEMKENVDPTKTCER